ncbi:MAG TPA: alanine--tRNA ligase [Oligoflexia bacterium]|nr:alanine--tRNA ligase [Oligoflexia bacterium]HMR24493.1 alanine--tRNA ligase [Oligoflexia bacterium]
MSKKIVQSHEIRETFLSFFESKQHKRVQSASLVPAEDPTLLFTNAGMNQFKGVFTGEEQRSYNKAASVQKCVRAGGKHNDLENVGYTARHHTFFEMLGNFSFGDYFKKEAIAFAWEFTTQYLQFPLENLYVTVYQDDEDAYNIWKNDIGLDASRIFRFGEKDNFWSMGDVGPCGPCTELFYDQGESVPGEKLGDDSDRFLEFWNLVFMEFEQKKDGSRIKLPNPSIDTGMGLERASALAQGVSSNYESDLFIPLLNHLGQSSAGKNYNDINSEQQASYRVIADHLRCMTFLIADGVLPSNEGRGYVLRRIMRRAMRHGKKIGFEKPFLHRFSLDVIESMQQAYPELQKYNLQIQDCIESEEKRFSQTIDRGMKLLEEEIVSLNNSKSSELSGEVAFHLYDTYGFPVDMTADILRENNLTLDEVGFDQAFAEHKEKAKGSWKKSNTDDLTEVLDQWKQDKLSNHFLGYDSLTSIAKITALVKQGKSVDVLKEGETGLMVCDQTPFYGESGGQVGDQGLAESTVGQASIIDTQKYLNDLHVHSVHVERGKLELGDNINLSVDAKLRQKTAQNHTATHLLHAALIQTLGEHVRQKGSLVGPDKLRFDFSHSKALTTGEIKKIEQVVNEQIWSGKKVEKKNMSMEQAIASGAMALFGEKYGEEVRVVSIGNFSVELCGGTHLDASHEIGLLKIIKESSVSAGVRRIEALTSDSALRYLNKQEEQLHKIVKKLNVSADKLEEKIEQLIIQGKQKQKPASAQVVAKFEHATQNQINNVDVVYQIFDGMDVKTLRDVSDRYLEKIQAGVVILASTVEGKVSLLCKVSKNLTPKIHAGQLVKEAAVLIGGSGGGRPDMAQAGGQDASKIDAAIEHMLAIMKKTRT